MSPARPLSPTAIPARLRWAGIVSVLAGLTLALPAGLVAGLLALTISWAVGGEQTAMGFLLPEAAIASVLAGTMVVTGASALRGGSARAVGLAAVSNFVWLGLSTAANASVLSRIYVDPGACTPDPWHHYAVLFGSPFAMASALPLAALLVSLLAILRP